MQLHVVALLDHQALGLEQVQQAAELLFQPRRPPDVEILRARRDTRVGAGVEERNQVREVVGVKVGQDDVLDLVLVNLQLGEPGGDPAAEVENDPQLTQL